MRFPFLGMLSVLGEEGVECVWCDDGADSENVDVCFWIAEREGLGNAFHAEFGGGVGVHGCCWGLLGDRERRVVDIAFGIADTIGGDAACEDDFLDSEFAGGFDDVVAAHGIYAKEFVVGYEHGAGDACEMDYGVRGLERFLEGLADVEVAGKAVESLGSICQVGLQCIYIWIIKWCNINI